ncbi:9953_t:CDS:1 [Funneliformis caledonium]|uniref:9953_t:CDS:1 n=1 Tax=Funneliformis caledonium TaxID=1117310 RepID=A0A9N9CZ15_9GLOM|nr:9953_t:CDS:1 [Funneliformis caledonium]
MLHHVMIDRNQICENIDPNIKSISIRKERRRYNQFREIDDANILLDKELDQLVSSSDKDEDWFNQSDDNEDDTLNKQFISSEFNDLEIESDYEYSNTSADFSDMWILFRSSNIKKGFDYQI